MRKFFTIIRDSRDPIDFMHFFAITGLVVEKHIVCDKRRLCVSMFGAYSSQENTDHMPLGESGFYASYKYVPKTLKYEDLDAIIYEYVQHISESVDYMNYIVVPLDREMPLGIRRRIRNSRSSMFLRDSLIRKLIVSMEAGLWAKVLV